MMAKPNAGKDAKKLYHSYNAHENIKWYVHSRNQFDTFFKYFKMQLSHNQVIALLGIILDKWWLMLKQKLMNVYSSFISNSHQVIE